MHGRRETLYINFLLLLSMKQHPVVGVLLFFSENSEYSEISEISEFSEFSECDYVAAH